MISKMSQETFVARVSKINPNFEILSEYKGMRQPVLRKCKVCGDTREVHARMLLEGRGCVKCVSAKRGISLRKSNEQFLKEMQEMHPDILLLSEYVANNRKVKCRCLHDGTEWETLPHALLGGSGCPVCGRKNNEIASRPSLTHAQFIDKVHTRFPKIEVLSHYHGTGKKVSYCCTECNYEWTAFAMTILKSESKGCPKCSGRAKVDIETFLSRLEMQNPGVQYISGYNGMANKATFECSLCKNIWEALPSNILAGKGCPACNLSHGAKKIRRYLEKNMFNFVPKYKFENCRDERPLPFDFYLPEWHIAIEYDGEQHFEPTCFGPYDPEYAINRMIYIQYHDTIKTEYCANNNIKLIRIPYTDLDRLELILDKSIS